MALLTGHEKKNLYSHLHKQNDPITRGICIAQEWQLLHKKEKQMHSRNNK